MSNQGSRKCECSVSLQSILICGTKIIIKLEDCDSLVLIQSQFQKNLSISYLEGMSNFQFLYYQKQLAITTTHGDVCGDFSPLNSILLRMATKTTAAWSPTTRNEVLTEPYM